MNKSTVLSNVNALTDSTKVIVLTANAVNGARENYLARGFDDYISKPIEVDVLESKLRKYLPKALIEKTGNGKNGKNGKFTIEKVEDDK